MKDSMKSCQHTLPGDAVYKEVVVIGNGPSGMVTSFMLAGNVPYLTDVPDDLPIDEMLRARLSNLPRGQSLYEADLMALAEGLEGRSQNPIPLLMDNLLRPCTDLGIQADPLIEWKYEPVKEIDHVVFGRGPPGGAWARFPQRVLTLSPAAWLSLPPHAPRGAARRPARAVAHYCRRYVVACGLQKYFRCGVIVTGVTRVPHAAQSGVRCPTDKCPLNARFYVSGYDKSDGRRFRYACRRVVVACGGGDRPNTLAPPVAQHAVHSLAEVERAVNALSGQARGPSPPTVLVVGSGVSAADALLLCARAGLPARHVHRAPAPALAALDPAAYPDYHQVYKMMCDGPSGNHPNYTPHPEHVVLDVTPVHTHTDTLDSDDIDDHYVQVKRVKMLDLNTNVTTEIQVNLIAVFIGSKPDLFFLQTNYLNCIDKTDCPKCDANLTKRKMEEKQCFLKNHWHYLKTMLGQSIQICKSRYLSSEINGNDAKCGLSECDKNFEVIPYSDDDRCQCGTMDPFSTGVGFGSDPTKPVDGRNNPIAINKSTHEILNAPEGMYALGPLTADNFVRFIPGGALAIVAHLHKNQQ